MNSNVETIVAELRQGFEALYGERLVQMILFGSQAREQAPADSDIDILVVLKGPVDPGEEIARTGTIVSELCLASEVVIACVFMDQNHFLHRQGPLLRNVRREGIRI